MNIVRASWHFGPEDFQVSAYNFLAALGSVESAVCSVVAFFFFFLKTPIVLEHLCFFVLFFCFLNLFIFGCVGSPFLCEGFL